jgi:hypothetical protein
VFTSSRQYFEEAVQLCCGHGRHVQSSSPKGSASQPRANAVNYPRLN